MAKKAQWAKETQSSELRDKVKQLLEKEGRKQSVQFEEASEEVQNEEDGKKWRVRKKKSGMSDLRKGARKRGRSGLNTGSATLRCKTWRTSRGEVRS